VTSSAGLPSPAPAPEDFHRVAEAGIDTRQYIGLDRNERVAPFPDWFIEGIRRSVTSNLLMWYPVQDQLEQQLSEHLQLPKERLLLTPSSDAAIKAIYQAYVRPGDKVVMLDPSYAMFPVYASMFQAKTVPVGFDHTPSLDTDLLLNSVAPGVRAVMIANPNQPTATLLEEDVLLEVVRRAAEVEALVVMDEAYYPFSHSTALPWVESHPNLLIMRTFSKAAGLAGLRIGFLAGHPEVIANLYKVRTVNDMNSFALLCAGQVLNHPEVIDDYVTEVEAGCRLLASKAGEFGLIPLPTHTNFMLLRVAHRCRPADLVAALRRHGYLVKSVDSLCVADCIRVTLGPPDLMASFSTALERALSEVAKENVAEGAG